MRAVLRTALNDAVKWGIVPRNAATLVDLPRVTRGDVHVFDSDGAKAFLAATKKNRVGALFSVALAVGLRLGEALGLGWADVDLKAKTIRIRRALQHVDKKPTFVEPKSERSRRTASVPEFAIVALTRQRTAQKQERLQAGSKWNDSGLVFTSTIGTPLDERNVRRAFGDILLAAKQSPMRIHDLRHTCASLLLEQGVHARVVVAPLGHSQIGLTLDTYSHVLPAPGADAAAKMDSLIGVKTGSTDATRSALRQIC